MASPLVKTGIAFPRDVLERLDMLVKEMGLPSRSHAVVEATMKYLAERIQLINSVVVEGVLCITCSSESQLGKVSEIEQVYSDVVKASIYFRMNNLTHLRFLVVSGSSSRIRSLIRDIERIGSTYVITNVLASHSKDE